MSAVTLGFVLALIAGVVALLLGLKVLPFTVEYVAGILILLACARLV